MLSLSLPPSLSLSLPPSLNRACGRARRIKWREAPPAPVWKNVPLAKAAAKRALEYGVRAPVFYGSLREQTGENGFPETYRNIVLFLQKSPKVSGNRQEFTGERNLAILYSSSLLSALRDVTQQAVAVLICCTHW